MVAMRRKRKNLCTLATLMISSIYLFCHSWDNTRSSQPSVCSCGMNLTDAWCTDPRSAGSAAQKVVSFSVFSSSHWLKGIEKNALEMGVYPGWVMRVYHNFEESHKGCQKLCQLRELFGFFQICQVGYDDVPGTLWRFLPMKDPRVAVFLSRDSDSTINPREAAAVEQWLAMNTTLHTMNDHPGHVWPVMAGMFGLRLDRHERISHVQTLNQMFHEASLGLGYFKEADQCLLRAVLYERFKNDWTNHAAYHCNAWNHTSLPFPTQRQDGRYIGERTTHHHWTLDYLPEKLSNVMLKLHEMFFHPSLQECPTECRLDPSWRYC